MSKGTANRTLILRMWTRDPSGSNVHIALVVGVSREYVRYVLYRPKRFLRRVAERLGEMGMTFDDLAKGIRVTTPCLTELFYRYFSLRPHHRKDIAIWCHRTEAELFGEGKS